MYHVLQTRDRLERNQNSISPSSNDTINSSSPSTLLSSRTSTSTHGTPITSLAPHPPVVGVSRSALNTLQPSASADQKSGGYAVVMPRSDPGYSGVNQAPFKIPSGRAPTSETHGDRTSNEFFGTPKSVEMMDAFPPTLNESDRAEQHNNTPSFTSAAENQTKSQQIHTSSAPMHGQQNPNMETIQSKNTYSGPLLTKTPSSFGQKPVQFSSSGYSGSITSVGGISSSAASAPAPASVASSGLSSAPASFTSEPSEVSTLLGSVVSSIHYRVIKQKSNGFLDDDISEL